MHNYFGAIKNWIKVFKASIKIKSNRFEKTEEFKLPEDIDFCHRDKVHIFVRGLADGKIHVAKNRFYSDVRFYKKHNLKVFCASCRKRVI